MADVELNLNGNIVNQFKALAREASEAQKSIERLKKQMESMTAKGSPAFNSKTSQILSSTSFSSIQDLFAEIKSNKLMGAPGGTQTAQAAKQLTNLRNILKSVGNKELQEDIGGVTGRIDNVVRAMSGKAPGKNPLSQVMIPDAQLKGHEEEIKKSILGISDYIIKLEKSLTGINSVAQKEYKKANPKKAQNDWKNDVRTKDFSYSSERYAKDEKYRKHVDNAMNYYQMKAANYGTIGESALTNASLKAGKVFGNTKTQYNGFFQELAQGLRNGINDGMKDFDLGELLSENIKKGGRFKKQNKILEKLGYDSDFLGMTEAFQNTKSFKEFADKKRAEMGEFGKNWDNKSIFSAFKGTAEFKELTRKVKENKEIDFSKLTKQDRSKVLAGLSNNKEAAGMMGGLKMGGVFLTAAAGVGKLAEAAVKLGTEAVKAYEGVQQLQTQLGVVFGTKVQSSSMFSQIEDYAKKSPFGVEGMVQNAVLLKQSGVYGSELMDTMKRLGDISSGNNEKMKSVSEVYARVMSSQTVTARDMRQLANAGVPAYSALADATGIDRGQIRNKLQSGQIKATDFEAMLKKLTDKGGMFYGATATGAQTLAAKKQNLSDARQMMMASFGERLARFGGATTQDSFYGKTLDFLQGIFNGIEEGNKIANRKADEAAPEMIQKKIEELEKKRDKAKNGKQRQEIDDEINMYKAALKPAEQQAVASGEEDWKDAQEKIKYFMEVLDSAGQGEISKAFHSTQEITDTLKYLRYLRNGEVNFDGTTYTRSDFTEEGGSTLLEGKKDRWEEFNTIMESLTGKKSQAVSFGEGNDEALGKALNKSKLQFDATYLEVLSSQASNELYHFYSEVAKATEEGNTWLNKAIENTVDTFDKFETVNVGPGSKNNYGAQHLMNSADEYYRENSSVYKMHWKDQKAYYDEMAKQEILDYDKKSKTGKKDAEGNDIYSFAKMTAEQMQRAQELLTTNAEKIMSQGTKYDFLDDKDMVTEEGSEKIRKLRDNFSELLEVAENTGGEGVFGDDFMKDMKELTKLLTNPNFGDAAQNIATINDMISHIARSGGSLAAKREAIVQQISHGGSPEQIESLQNQLKAIDAMAKNRTAAVEDRTYSAKKAEKINARLAPSLRAQVLSQVTGVSADRVANSKESSVMNAYLNNFSQRQTFAQLGKVLMQNGAELKDVARAMQEGKNGQKYGMYDWNKSTSSIEEQAAQKNIATQEALISAYQQQIDALQELTVGSIATRDQWDNLGSLSAQLGVAFELSAKTLADGTVQFTDATIQSAHKMMEELDFKKFNQQMTTIINKIEDQQHKEEGEAKIGSAVLEGKVSTSYVSSKNYGIIKQGLAEQVDKIKNEKDSTLKAGLNKSSFAGKEEAEEYVRTVNKKMKELGLKEIEVTIDTKKTTKGVATQSLVKEIDKLTNDRLTKEYEKYKQGGGKQNFYTWADEKQYYEGWGMKPRYEMAYKDTVAEKGLGGSTFGIGYSKDGFYMSRLQGKEVKSLPAWAETKDAKTTYSVQLDSKDVDKIVNSVKEDLTSGNVTDADVELVASLGGVRDKMGVLIDSIDKNTAAQDHENSLKEMEDIRGKMLDYLGSHGLLGGTEEERKRNKALRNDKAFADMDTSNPLINKINTPHQDRLLELAGLSRNVDYDEFRKRRVNKIVNFGTDDKGKEKYLGLKDDAAVEEMRHYMTDTSSSKYVKKLKKAWNKDTGNEGVEKLKGQLKESGFDPFAKDALGEMDTSQLQTMLELFDQMGISVRELAAGGQEWDETLMDASLQLEELSQGIKNTAMDGLVKGLNTGFSKAGDLAYKLQNNLIEGADATMEMKKALAGVGAEMLNNIGAAMTETGLKIAGGAAAQAGGPNWSLVAAGLALAAAGGAASFGGGMLSAFASDNNKGNSDEAEDQLARLEDLKDNLAELLKQAKDDAIYYETNMRNKQALVFNDALSSTSVNDAIITPRGVVNTAPDDYIMAMKDPTHLMGKGGGATNVSFSIVNESGTPMTVTGSETRQNGDTTEITAIVNAIVQKSMNDGEYDDVMAGMQLRQRGSQISS